MSFKTVVQIKCNKTITVIIIFKKLLYFTDPGI